MEPMENKQTYDSSWVRSGKTDAPGIREQLRSVPEEPGCYLWKDRNGAILYVGKAIDLRARMTSVFIQGMIMSGNVLFGLPPIAWMLFLIAMYALECLVAFLQAYVFSILTSVYIGGAISTH